LSALTGAFDVFRSLGFQAPTTDAQRRLLVSVKAACQLPVTGNRVVEAVVQSSLQLRLIGIETGSNYSGE